MLALAHKIVRGEEGDADGVGKSNYPGTHDEFYRYRSLSETYSPPRTASFNNGVQRQLFLPVDDNYSCRFTSCALRCCATLVR